MNSLLRGEDLQVTVGGRRYADVKRVQPLGGDQHFTIGVHGGLQRIGRGPGARFVDIANSDDLRFWYFEQTANVCRGDVTRTNDADPHRFHDCLFNAPWVESDHSPLTTHSPLMAAPELYP